MESVNGNSILKVARFITINLVILIFCMSCNHEIDNNPKIILSGVESVTATSAVLVASLTTPDKPLLVLFEYYDNETWQQAFTEIYPANQTVIVKKEIKNLTQGKVYQFRVSAGYLMYSGLYESYSSVLTASGTKEFKTLDQSIINLTEIKIGLTTLSLKINFVPNFDNTKIQVDYTTNSTTLSKLSDSSYNGHTGIDINFDLDNLTINTNYQIRIKALNSSAVVLDTIIKTGAVVDYDGNVYRIVTIGSQVWLQENFKGTHYANGDAIPNVTDQTDWANQKTGAYCYYNNNPELGKVYGALYNWYAATDSRGLIVGYHTSSYEDWETLKSYLGGIKAGGALKETGLTHWIAPNEGATNSSGFTGLPAGERSEKVFSNLGDGVGFWTNTIYPVGGMAYLYDLGQTSPRLGNGGDSYYYGLSLRLVKN